MSSPAGWYPDPGGRPSTFRYWDGRSWSAATTTNPTIAPPSLGTADLGTRASAYSAYQSTTRSRSGRGWWLATIAVVVVLVVVVVIGVRALTGSGGPLGGQQPGAPASADPCPPESSASTPEAHPADGRVHGGPVSYPALGAPWSAPASDYRVPFGSDVAEQEIVVEPSYAPGSSWVASVLVARLAAGDGFFTPQQGSQIVVRCVLGRFYGDATVRSDVKKNQKTTIDGHDAWLVESHLSFDIPNLRTKGELLIVAVVATGPYDAGLFYASIPDTSPQYVPAARQALAELKVDT